MQVVSSSGMSIIDNLAMIALIGSEKEFWNQNPRPRLKIAPQNFPLGRQLVPTLAYWATGPSTTPAPAVPHTAIWKMLGFIFIQIEKIDYKQNLTENANVRFGRVVNSAICGKWTNLPSPACDEPGSGDESNLREHSSTVDVIPIAEGLQGEQ